MATADASATLRVSIGEDDVLLREGIVRILDDAGLDVVAQVGDAEELVRRTLAYAAARRSFGPSDGALRPVSS